MRKVYICMKAFNCWSRGRDARHIGGQGKTKFPEKATFSQQLKNKKLGFIALLLELLKSEGKEKKGQ